MCQIFSNRTIVVHIYFDLVHLREGRRVKRRIPDTFMHHFIEIQIPTTLNDLDPQFVERNSQYLSYIYVVNAIHAVLLSMSIYQLSREIVFQRIYKKKHIFIDPVSLKCTMLQIQFKIV